MEQEKEVTEVTWMTRSDGQILFFIHFEAFEYKEQFVDHVRIPYVIYSKYRGIGSGALVLLVLSDEGFFRVKEVIRTSDMYNYPEQCPACQTPLKLKQEVHELYCPSYSCPAKEITCLFRLFEVTKALQFLPEFITNQDIEYWLNNYPILGGSVTIKIQTIIEFIEHFKQTGKKLSAHRLSILKEKFGDRMGKIFFEFETQLEQRLEAGITYKEFWYIQNIPGLDQAALENLTSICPYTGTLQKLLLSDITPNILNVLAQYQDRWIKIAQFWVHRFPIISS